MNYLFWRKPRRTCKKNLQGVKHRKSKEKDILCSKQFFPIAGQGLFYLTPILNFFPNICIMYCCIKNSLNFYYIYISKEQTLSLELISNSKTCLYLIQSSPGLLQIYLPSVATLMSYPLLGLLSGFSIHVVLHYYYRTHF